MIGGQKIVSQKARFYSSVVLLNVATLLFITYIFQPFGLLKVSQPVFASIPTPSAAPVVPDHVPVAGKPTRIQIIEPENGLDIDLAVKDGAYDVASATWTLGRSDAYFALPSVPVNDTRGTTLIYGHNEKEVFGYLSALHEGTTAYALVHTDTGKIFRYNYRDAANVKPDDNSVFRTDGPPTLMVQTCSGSWFELRRLYRFTFDRLEPAV